MLEEKARKHKDEEEADRRIALEELEQKFASCADSLATFRYLFRKTHK